MENQRTIKKAITAKGKGIHTGNSVTLTLKPAGPNSGILFKRTDVADAPLLKAETEYLLNGQGSSRHSSLGFGGVEIHTVEHFLAALSGLGIDNIIAEIDNNELPALDGSAMSFVKLIHEAGIQELEARKKSYVLKEPVWVEYGNAFMCALPSSKLRISYTLQHDTCAFLKTQYLATEINPEIFERDFASSRTFVLEHEIEALLKQGFGKGATHENTLVVSEKGVVKNTLRFHDEPLRHKILDIIGDMYLLGRSLQAHIIAVRSGHALNHQLLRKLKAVRDTETLAALHAQPTAIAPGQGLDIQAIKRILPHRYPFLLVDRIIEFEVGKRAVGIKNVTANETFFNGHFPDRPVMPGVLIVEAMAQVGGVLMLSPEEHKGKLAFFMSMNNVKFRKTVVPGDQLVLEVKVGKIRSRVGQLLTQALVGGEVVAEAELMFALVDE